MARERDTRPLFKAIRCPVELRDVSGVRAGLATLVEPDGVHVQLSLDEAKTLSPGSVVEIIADTPPFGPLRTRARVASLQPDRDGYGRPVVSTALAFDRLNEDQQHALTGRLLSVRPTVVTRGLTEPLEDSDGYRVVQARSTSEILDLLGEQDIAVIILGPESNADESRRVTSACRSDGVSRGALCILAGIGAGSELLEDVLAGKDVFYFSHAPLPPAMLSALVAAAVHLCRERGPRSAALDGVSAEIIDFCFRIASETDVTRVGSLIVEAATSVVDVTRAEYLTFEPRTDQLVLTDILSGAQRSTSAALGLAGYVVRTGRRLEAYPAGLDARLDVKTGHIPKGDQSRVLAEPITATAGHVLGVLILWREEDAAPFSPTDIEAVELLAAYVGTALSALLQRRQAYAALLQKYRVVGDVDIYRQEALESLLRKKHEEGSLLQLSPKWLRVTPWVAAALFVVGVIYMSVVKVDDLISGPAVIQATNKIEVIATRPGIIRSVAVSVGERVRTGDLLMRVAETPGTASEDRVVEQVWAAGSGVIGNIRVRAGQQVRQGEVVASIVDDAAGLELVAFMPGQHAPQIRTRMPLVLRLHGYQGSYEVLQVDQVGAQVVDAQDALRYAGRANTSGIPVAGTIVIVSCRLQSQTFFYDSRTYRYFDGMTGDADVTIGSVPLIVTLIRGIMPRL